jgi:hypothetical protein
MKLLKDVEGLEIRLTDERLAHILEHLTDRREFGYGREAREDPARSGG